MIKSPIPVIKAASKSIRAWYSEDLKKHDQLMNLLETYYKIHSDNNDQYAEKLTWCLENCQNKFRDLKHGDGIIWYFENERDATMFALKWL